MKLSVSQVTLWPLTLDAELDALVQNDVPGIGLFADKIPAGEEAAHSARLRAAGLQATVCLPSNFTVFANDLFGGPRIPPSAFATYVPNSIASPATSPSSASLSRVRSARATLPRHTRSWWTPAGN